MSKNKALIINKLSEQNGILGIDKDIIKDILSQMNINEKVIEIKNIGGIHKDFYGGRGKKNIVEVTLKFDVKLHLFIKEHCTKSPNEALHYRFLSRFNAPIPKLYASFSKKGFNDVIVTEVVEPFLVDDDSLYKQKEEIFKPFIETTAKFNSINITDKYKEKLIKDYDLVKNHILPMDKKIINAFEKMRTLDVYSALSKFCDKVTENKLLLLHKKACESILNMKKGLYHWDHKPRNMGFSNLQNKFVIFDLEDTLWEPRFFNIGMHIGGNDKHEKKYESREKLAKLYLDIYNTEKNNKISVDCLLNESYPIWIAFKLLDLLYVIYEAGNEPRNKKDRNNTEYKKESQNKIIETIEMLCDL